jgi:DNA-binding NarL/FixJ family response regulator
VFVRTIETRAEALRLVTAGLKNCEIARRLDVPRTTIRD